SIDVSVSLEAAGQAESTLRFAVRDTGLGIARDKQALIFEAFAQVDGSMRRQQGGTGLGLTICSKLVHLMKGLIWVERKPGAGSVFFFTAKFELRNIAVAAREKDRSSVPRTSRPLKVLVVEDNLVNQTLTQRLLEKMGHSVMVAQDGSQAVEAVVRQPF